MIETAIDNWLNSLTGVQEDVRKQFRQGISKIAEQADMKNAAWEVCSSSCIYDNTYTHTLIRRNLLIYLFKLIEINRL